ncbi:uncharacterized protein LOC105229499 isoform X1 [Bactrocera dorsalis]|uniref:Uncharacterized protein LOC105229499 isoform X1 n=1 Tax=Bactrocera dorsalis TaxID=27457 RepID=A0A6I9VEF5_BACDO|nr:uncharacterized protein LOC105229499 isoform X1 [Bactrocera dorsalis]
MSCFPRQSECCCCSSCSPCCNYMGDCCNIRRNRSCIDCFPTRMIPDVQVPPKKPKSRSCPIKSSMSKNNNNKRPSQIKNGKRSNVSAESEPSMESKNPKQTKNKQNFQYQDQKKRMEVISEEAEQDSDEEPFSKNIQNSCADFLSIVHDTVLETVQSSVECMMRNYFVHTMEKVETLCSQMMRNECLLSKMYLDILDKISQQSEKSLRQFKCLCQFIAETQREVSEDRTQNQRCNCPNCTGTEESFISLAKERAVLKGRRLSGSGNSNINFNVYKSELNARNYRDPDNEVKPKTSLTSCTNLAQSKPKLLEKPPGNIGSLSNEAIRRNIRRLNESDHFEFSNNRRIPEPPRVDDSFKMEQYENRIEGGKYVSVKTGPSETNMPEVKL